MAINEAGQDEAMEEIRRIRAGVDRIVEILSKQPSMAMRVLTLAANISGAAGIIFIIDLIIKWLGG